MAAATSDVKETKTTEIRLGVPKGHMQENVLKLLEDAGIKVVVSSRGYRPSINLPDFSVKMLKPQNILEMLHYGSRDLGFGGLDWVQNLGLDVIELLDTGLDPVRIVAAAPDPDILAKSKAAGRKVVIASEYEKLTKDWMEQKGIDGTFVRSFGATESFPPEDADLIVDNAATGATLQANSLKVIDTLTASTTRVFTNKAAMADPEKKKRIDEFVLLLKSVLEGRAHKMIEFNLAADVYQQVINDIPALKSPTVSQLHNGKGFAVKIAAPKDKLPLLLPKLKKLGATEIVVTDVHQMVL